MSEPRVVSLVPSMTETLMAWGVVPVACTRFCEQPELVHVGGTKDPDIAAIVDLAPDVVVLDAEENRRDDFEALEQAGLEVLTLRIRSLTDLDVQMPAVAERVGSDVDADRDPDRRRRVGTAFVPIWKRPWMALGAPTYGSSVLAAIGVSNVYADDGPYPEVTLEDAALRRPDRVIAPDEPYPFAERHRAELSAVAPVTFVDGRDLVWWGERTRHALTRLAEALRVSPR